MKVINFFGAPGAGKSTTAAGLFYHLKKGNHRVELVTEYAKDMVWEGRKEILDCQYYIFAKQLRRLQRLLSHNVDMAITDSPLLIGAAYVKESPVKNLFLEIILHEFNQFENINFYLKRHHDKPYQQYGRDQTEVEAGAIGNSLLQILNDCNVDFYNVSRSTPDAELDFILSKTYGV